jgi:hypothetical protein
MAGIVALVLSDWLQDAWGGTHNTNNVVSSTLSFSLYTCCWSLCVGVCVLCVVLLWSVCGRVVRSTCSHSITAL